MKTGLMKFQRYACHTQQWTLQNICVASPTTLRLNCLSVSVTLKHTVDFATSYRVTSCRCNKLSLQWVVSQWDVTQQVVAATSSPCNELSCNELSRNELSATRCHATSWSQRVVASPLLPVEKRARDIARRKRSWNSLMATVLHWRSCKFIWLMVLEDYVSVLLILTNSWLKTLYVDLLIHFHYLCQLEYS